MINRELWESSVKEVRQKILDKTHDPAFRRIAAGIMDAAFDDLFDVLGEKDTFHDTVTLTLEQYERASDCSLQMAREMIPAAPDWLESVLSAFSTQLKCDLFYPEKED